MVLRPPNRFLLRTSPLAGEKEAVLCLPQLFCSLPLAIHSSQPQDLHPQLDTNKQTFAKISLVSKCEMIIRYLHRIFTSNIDLFLPIKQSSISEIETWILEVISANSD